jgi:hypothetical protein
MTFYDMLVSAVTALTPLGLVLVVYHTGRQARLSSDKAAVAAERVEASLARSDIQTEFKLDQIHVLVNSRLSEALAKIDRLEARLFAVTGEIPTGEPTRQESDR